MPLALALLVGFLAAFASSAAAAETRAVAELFTSQGCSSCRNADAYFAELAGRDDVVALAMHVDYWDYLGWRDTFGLPENTARQRGYAEVLGSRRIYTPQLIVNGATEVLGSDRPAAEAAIAAAVLPVPVDVRAGTGTVDISVGARPLPGSVRSTIRLVLFSSEVRVAIARGENAGETIGYRNVVRAVRPIGMWDGAPVKIALPMDELMADGVDGCAVLVQEDGPGGSGAILGAAKLERW
jgi:hypothetical protein